MIPLTLSIALSLLLFGSGDNSSHSFSRTVNQSAIQKTNDHLLPLINSLVVYRTYANARFNYSISYPSCLLIPQGESRNSDGQIFQRFKRQTIICCLLSTHWSSIE